MIRYKKLLSYIVITFALPTILSIIFCLKPFHDMSLGTIIRKALYCISVMSIVGALYYFIAAMLIDMGKKKESDFRLIWEKKESEEEEQSTTGEA